MTIFLVYMKIAGKEISDKKHVVISLCGIYGIGRPTSKKILGKLGIKESTLVRDLTDTQQRDIVNELDNYLINMELKRRILDNVANLIAIQCYRGIRLRKGLPARGQNTHTNSKTCRRNSLLGDKSNSKKNASSK